jgi:hypothetical protein
MMTKSVTGRRRVGWPGLLLAAAVAVAGCGKGSAGSAKSFDSAPPEIKAAWEAAVTADKTNGYVAAVTGYRALLQQRDQLSEVQLTTVQEAQTKAFQRLVNASTKGDEAARAALMALQPRGR